MNIGKFMRLMKFFTRPSSSPPAFGPAGGTASLEAFRFGGRASLFTEEQVAEDRGHEPDFVLPRGEILGRRFRDEEERPESAAVRGGEREIHEFLRAVQERVERRRAPCFPGEERLPRGEARRERDERFRPQRLGGGATGVDHGSGPEVDKERVLEP